jgi:hypothetical protein
MLEQEQTKGMTHDRLQEKKSANNVALRRAFFSFFLFDAILVSEYTLFNSTQA